MRANNTKFLSHKHRTRTCKIIYYTLWLTLSLFFFFLHRHLVGRIINASAAPKGPPASAAAVAAAEVPKQKPISLHLNNIKEPIA